MRGLNLKPSRLHRVATQALSSQGLLQPPCWYTIMTQIPPPEIMTRTQPITHHERPAKKSKVRKPSKSFRPLPIIHAEDKLRSEFFKDHPWELARPRVVLEDDGRDGQMCDWSTGIVQPGRPTNGER